MGSHKQLHKIRFNMKKLEKVCHFVPANANVLGTQLRIGDMLKIYGTISSIKHIRKNIIRSEGTDEDYFYYTVSFDYWGRGWYDVSRHLPNANISLVEIAPTGELTH